ncbi:hypothetical protein K3495_g1456 [Podosphaera aphanis]|nr:hypothetical protein K3495_g1456 [Podosphaera aphanis]
MASSTTVDAAHQELHSLYQILHLAHHRNKNQHRLSKWYKSFSQLRRQIAKLRHELTQLDMALSLSSDESKYVQKARSDVGLRTTFMRHHLVPKCYKAFGNLVADNQYATLGLLIMGVLAGLWSVLEVISPDHEDVQHQSVELAAEPKPKVKTVEDLGEVISRFQSQDQSEKRGKEKLDVEKEPRKRKAREEKQKMTAEPRPTKKPKKHKKRDVFDDIFKGLA